MQRNLLIEAKKHIQSNRRHRVWQKFVRVMAGCVVFCTTYALILPAITMEQEAFCGYEEHTHSEECYVRTSPSLKLTCSPDELELHVHSERCLDADGNTVCGLADYVAHTHTADCFDENGLVVCAFPEIGQHVHDSSCYSVPETTAQSHTHSDSCYSKEKGELICTTVQQEAHTHTDACYAAEKALVCTTAESAGHAHSDSCYTAENVLTCTTAESAGHTHADECYDAEGALVCTTAESAGHTHGDGCYTVQQNLTCGQTEQEAHTHGDSCYETPIVCGLIETEGHAHTDACYAWNETVICGLEETPIPEPELICTAPIAEAHVHSADCFETIEEPLTCQLEESEEHTHTALCYGTWKLACPKEEHTHELICFSDPEADLETAEVWEKTFKDVELTGVWADDVLAIAKTQIGYAESTRNYEVWEDGTVHGYTRYGDWFGSPYGDWCAMLVSFCIHYAEIDGVPLNWGCRTWIEELSKDELDLYREAGEYDPKPGDIIFFDWEDENGDSDDLADHVGLVAELIPATGTEPAKIKTIEGNSSSQVKYNKYDADDTEILGYGIMPENPELEAEEETVTALYTYSDDNVYVGVQLPEDTTVPADAVLTVTPIASDDEGYDDYVAQAEEAVEGNVANIALYDISFYTADGTYYPVDDTAKVTMGFVESPVDTTANVQVLHFAEEGAIPEVIEDVTVGEKEIEMVLEDVQLTDAPAAAALEQQPMASLFSRAVPAATAETEPEVQTITETRTVVEFETPGFSTFAVVQVQTGSYTATALTDVEIKAILDTNNGTASLDGRIFVIGPDYGIDGVNYALTNETVTIHEKYPDNAAYDHEFERLKAGIVNRNGNTITTPADDGFLWKFIKVDGNNTYYIQSVETGQYLYIGPGRTVKTTATPNAIVVAYKGEHGRPNVSLQAASGEYLNCYEDIDLISEGIKVFDAKNDEYWNDMFLAEYAGVKKDETTAATDWPLDGRQFVISSLNGNTARVMTNEQAEDKRQNVNDRYLLKAVEKEATADNNGNLSYVALDGIVGASVWTFTKADQPNTYYIKAANGYLNLSEKEGINAEGRDVPESSLTLSETKQPITVNDNNNDNTVTLSASVVNASGETETRFVNYYALNENEGGPGFGCYREGTPLSLTEYIDQGSVLGTGGQFVISWLNNDKTKAVVMTSKPKTEDSSIADVPRSLLIAVEKGATVDANGNLSYVALDGIVETSVWTFMQVGEPLDTYYIQSADGKYLNLSVKEGENTPESSLTLSAEPQPINVTNSENNTVTLGASVVNASDVAETRYVNFYGENYNRGFGCYNRGTGLSLTEYIDQATVLGTNGGQFVISIPISGTNTASVLTNEQITDPAPNSTTQVLAAAVRTVDADGNLNIDRIDTSAVWDFQPVDGQANTYYIQSVATGEYLNLRGSGDGLTTSTGPQEIEVEFIGNQIALKLPGTNNYVHWQQFNGAKANRGFATWGGLDPKQTHLVLTKYTPTQEDPEQNRYKPVTNLADKIGILCAVDTPDPWVYSAIVTDKATDPGAFGDDRVGLQTVQTNPDMVDPDDKEFSTVVLTNYSTMIWKIIGTNAAGQYYIQSQDSGKYLHLDANGATLSDEPQTLEIIRAYTKWWPNAFCVRVPLNGTYYYLNLHGNKSANSVSTYAFPNSNTPTDTSSNFVFAELSEEEMAAIKVVTDLIDALPNQEELVNRVKDLLDADPNKHPGRDLLQEAHDLQTNTIAAASAAIDAYDALSAEQKLFVGVDRINKLEELREWLLDESAEGSEGSETAKETGRLPEVVPSVTASGVTVKLFDYNSAVTSEKFYTDGFKFFDQNGNSVDGYGSKEDYVDKVMVQHPNVTFKLNDQGYPVLVDVVDGVQKEIDLSNLFNGTNYQVGTMTDGGGLFRQDENGYYFYYSDMNAAYYDQTKNEFILYDTIVRPGNTSWNNDNLTWNPSGTYESDRRSNFLPFNELINEDGTSSIIYDSEYHQENNVQNIAGSHSLVLTDEPTPVPTAVLNDRTDLWFGMNIEFDFLMPEDGKVNGEDMMFDFHGDDDVWVFIDDVPVLNLVGTHAAWDGSIDFATGKVHNQYEDYEGTEGEALYKDTTLKELFLEAAGVTDENVTSVTINGKTIAFNGDTLADFTDHNLKFFYLERGGFISYSGIKFNMVPLPDKSLAVTKSVTAADGITKVNDQTYYTFRILQASDDNGDGKLSPFFGEGVTFAIWENGVNTGNIGFIDPDTGMFSIKAGQTAVFYHLLDNALDPSEHDLIVQEIIYNKETGQYQEVTINGVQAEGGVASGGNNTEYPERWGLQEGDKVYTSSTIDAADGGTVPFNNVITEPTSTLQITKEQTLGAKLEDKEFQFAVLLGDERIVSAADNGLDPDPSISEYAATMVDLSLIPVGTEYTVTYTSGEDTVTENKTVETAGMITLKVGQTATFDGLVLGTNFEVYEIVEEGGGYVVEGYKVVDADNNNINDATITASGAGGEITSLGQTVKVVVTNKPYSFALNLHISKQVIGFNKQDTFTFDIEEGKFDPETGEWTMSDDRPNAAITVTNGDITSGTSVLAFDSSNNGTHYFRIAEVNANGNYIYDTTVYFAEVNVTETDATMTNLWKIVCGSDGMYSEPEEVKKVEVSGGVEEYPISFVNYGTYATVTKRVTGDDTSGDFNFEATVVYDSNINYTWPSGSYTVGEPTTTADGKNSTTIEFTLQNAGSVTFPVPANSTLTVTETNPEGYTTSYQVSTAMGVTNYGTSAEVNVFTGPVMINFTNEPGYELPMSGGTGTYLYTLGGLLLTMAAILMYNLINKRRKEELASS